MSDENQGSIDKVISGEYEFTIGSLLSEAWSNICFHGMRNIDICRKA